MKIRRSLLRERFGEDETQVRVDLVIRSNGDLVLEGQDLGAAPREVWGDSDYEYWLTVKAENKERILEGLLEDNASNKDRDALLLDLLLERFGESKTPVSELERWLDERRIPYTFDSYA